MPNRDGTGPMGKGSGTGRRMGKCKTTEETAAKNENSEILGIGRGGRPRGGGKGNGFGGGRRRGNNKD